MKENKGLILKQCYNNHQQSKHLGHFKIKMGLFFSFCKINLTFQISFKFFSSFHYYNMELNIYN